MVPGTLLYKKGLKLIGTHPVSLEGYGATAIMMIRLLARGYDIYDMESNSACKGRGICGEAWKEAGRKATKTNTWKDLLPVLNT